MPTFNKLEGVEGIGRMKSLSLGEMAYMGDDTPDIPVMDAVGIAREGFVVHVFQGRETGVFGDNEGFGENGNEA